MTDDDRMIRVIKEYAYSYLDHLSADWPESEFKRVAYSRWAVNEILALIYLNPSWTPMRAVEEYKSMVESFYLMPTNYKDMEEIFNIAFSVASDLSDILEAMM